ncbi:hypothetical protein MTO96_028929 [Rhipicephalus appendiculatus]
MMQTGGFWMIFCYLGNGCMVVLIPTPEINAILSAVEKYTVTITIFYPTMIHKFNLLDITDRVNTRSLRKLIYGGSTVASSVLRSFAQKLHLERLIQGYGMTELSGCIVMSTQPDDDHSAGTPLPFNEIKVVHLDSRQNLGPYEQGEICVRGPSCFKGYLKGETKTSEAYENGFVRTGDLGYYSPDGRIFICGRLKELIKCMDQQVAPAELEELLATDPGVRHVIVLGVPHQQYGEAPRAFVVPRRRLPLDEEQREAAKLKELVSAKLARHKHLHGGVEFLDRIGAVTERCHPTLPSPRSSSPSEGQQSSSKVSVIIEEGVVKTCVKGAVIPDDNFERFFTNAWKQHEEVTALVDIHSGTTCTFGELLDGSRRVAASLWRLGLRPGDVVAFHGPNSSKLVVAMCGTFFAGGIGMLNKSSLTQVIRQLDQWPHYEDFDTSSLTKLLYGGGAVSLSVLKSVGRKFGLKELSQAYGMTELTSCIACSTHLDDLKSVGKPAPFVQIKVVDFHTRQPLGPNQQGEVCVKGPAAFKAYWNQPTATSAAYENGFVRTGDKGYYTEDGCFFLCGRFKELIKCMDQQVSPAELEELLASDPEVRHVVVAGVPHPQYGEAARAFVEHQRRLMDPFERQKEAERLKELVAGRLAYHKQLHSGVEFLDSIPRSEAGKDLRSALKKAYSERSRNSKCNEV